MIKFENTEVIGFEPALRGMRNPKNSWERSDSYFGHYEWDRGSVELGENDLVLMIRLAKGGPVHAKYRRMIQVYVDITAPLYWWKEFDTYKVGTVSNSCSTMHKIHDKEITIDDFSHEHLIRNWNVDNFESIAFVDHPLKTVFEDTEQIPFTPFEILRATINALNTNRDAYLKTKDKRYWQQMVQLLPSSYNQKRTIMMNYEVLVGIFKDRKHHKLDEWSNFCNWIETLPYNEIITNDELKEK